MSSSQKVNVKAKTISQEDFDVLVSSLEDKLSKDFSVKDYALLTAIYEQYNPLIDQAASIIEYLEKKVDLTQAETLALDSWFNLHSKLKQSTQLLINKDTIH